MTRLLLPATIALLLAIPLHAFSPTLPPGYKNTVVTLGDGFAMGSLAADPTDPNAFYVTTTETFAYYRDIDIVKVTLSVDGIGDTVAATQLIASGTTRLSGSGDGNDVLDNHFGNPSIARLTDGTMLVSDNDYGTSTSLPGGLGNAIIKLTDRNGDGDFRDIVGGQSEASLYATPIATTGGDFTGAEIAVDPGGVAYVTTTDGGGAGEVVRIGPGGAPQTVFADHIAYGAGIDFFAGDLVFSTSADFPATTGTLERARDLNADLDALDAGERTRVTDIIDPTFDLSVGPDGFAYVTTNSFGANRYRVMKVDPSSGGAAVFADFAPASGFQYMQGIQFSSGPGSFAPGSGPGTKRLAVLDSLNGLNIIEPVTPPAAVGNWEAYP